MVNCQISVVQTCTGRHLDKNVMECSNSNILDYTCNKLLKILPQVTLMIELTLTEIIIIIMSRRQHGYP